MCTKRMCTIASLRTHMAVIHRVRMPFPPQSIVDKEAACYDCEYCRASFALPKFLDKHMFDVHMGTFRLPLLMPPAPFTLFEYVSKSERSDTGRLQTTAVPSCRSTEALIALQMGLRALLPFLSEHLKFCC
ncbi:unnamed protein product [Schistocephalus solidus]|uniref:C2H2-type domain-containing protein n=1 Tax=Schistocephalus solidus TaxID=70667 RepID=A0A183TTN9_SCHSO|nr:unnamed protein product [Schistocephalus solidus]